LPIRSLSTPDGPDASRTLAQRVSAEQRRVGGERGPLPPSSMSDLSQISDDSAPIDR
jgi:hypothetical protein